MNRKLEKLMQSGLPVVLDYDGVLFEARWYEDTINMRDETYESLIAAFERGENLKTEPICCMQPVVEAVKGPLYVLSHMHHEIEFAFKKKQIAEFFPKIPVDHIIWSKSGEEKIKHLKEILEKENGFVYIDDNHPNLMLFESTFWDEKNCHFFHCSSLYV